MRITVTICAICASVAMLGCAQLPSDQGPGVAPQTCSSSPCAVPVGQSAGCWPLNKVIVADEIDVSVSLLPMTITWTLDANVPQDTYLNPGKPIVFDEKDDKYFDCSFIPPNPTKPRSYTCIDKVGTPKGKYKYTIKTKGWCSPPDLDPTVVNN